MSRATNAPASRARRRRRLEEAKGFRGARSKLFRTATEAVDRARAEGIIADSRLTYRTESDILSANFPSGPGRNRLPGR